MSGPERKVARRRPVQPPITKHDMMLVLERVEADARYLRVSHTTQHVLAVAVRTWMGGHGYFWPKRSVWAARANVCDKTITRATDDLLAVGLLAKTEYRRPDGFNGSCVYQLDPNIVGPELMARPAQRTGRDTVSPHVDAAAAATVTGGDFLSSGRRSHRQGQGVPAEGSRGTTPPRVRARPGGRHRAGAGKAKLRCPVCEIEFGAQSKLDDHLANVHDLPRAEAVA